MSTSARDAYKPAKLNQVVQNFFIKGAQIIVHSRVTVTPAYAKGSTIPKINKWFNVELEEPESFREDLRLWRGIDVVGGAGGNGGEGGVGTIPPLVVETYLDLRALTDQQSLLFIDSNGKSWNATKGLKKTEVVLERWVIDIVPSNREGSGSGGGSVGGSGSGSSSGLSDEGATVDLPVIYKMAVIVFRSLYTYVHLMPAWNLRRRISKAKLNVYPISIGCRIVNGSQPISSRGRIGLTKNITSEDSTNDSHLDTFHFSNVETPAGTLKISVSFRTNTNFRVGDSEALLSSHFLNMDQSKTHIIGAGSGASSGSTAHGGVIGQQSTSIDTVGGGLSGGVVSGSFASRRGSGPNTNLGGSSGSSSMSPGISSSPHPRPSVSFTQPFRSPSTAFSGFDVQMQSQQQASTQPVNSPRKSSVGRIPSNSSLAALRVPKRTLSTASATSITSISSASSYARSGTAGLGTNIPSSVGSTTGEAISPSFSSGSSNPRYSSSFGSRGQWNRSGSIKPYRPPSFVGDPASVGSNTSSMMDPGSGLYVQSNDLGDFVKMVDSAQGTFSHSPEASDQSSGHFHGPSHAAVPPQRPNPLARYQVLKDDHKALSESLLSSVYLPKDEQKPVLHIIPGSTSGQAGSNLEANLSTSSSPVRAGLSHTPVVPSRLSEELTIEDNSGRRSRAGRSSNTGEGGSTSTISSGSNSGLTRVSSRSRTRGTILSIYGGESHVTPTTSGYHYTSTSPLDIPLSASASSYSKPSHSRRESTSLSNRRTLGYEELHTQVDLESHHQSLNRAESSSTGAPVATPILASASAARRRSSFYLGDYDPSYRGLGNIDPQYRSRRGSSSGGIIPSGINHGSAINTTTTTSSGDGGNNPGYRSNLEQTFDDDDLLFAMSDMHIASPSTVTSSRPESARGANIDDADDDDPREYGPTWP